MASGELALVGNVLAVSGLGKAGLVSNSAIDSFMFYGENSPRNAATIELDNIRAVSAKLFTGAAAVLPKSGTGICP
jgi:hypothetical protein